MSSRRWKYKKKPPGRPAQPFLPQLVQKILIEDHHPLPSDLEPLVGVYFKFWPAYYRENHWVWDGLAFPKSNRGGVQLSWVGGETPQRRIFRYFTGFKIPKGFRLRRLKTDNTCLHPYCVNPAHYTIWPCGVPMTADYDLREYLPGS